MLMWEVEIHIKLKIKIQSNIMKIMNNKLKIKIPYRFKNKKEMMKMNMVPQSIKFQNQSETARIAKIQGKVNRHHQRNINIWKTLLKTMLHLDFQEAVEAIK